MVVTLDFDIIMHYVIEIYNDKISIGEYTVRDFIRDFPNFKEHLYPDLFLYQHLTSFLEKAKTKSINFIFIDSHEEIVDIIQQKQKKEKEIIIYNIDHHSDINYDGDMENTKIKTLTCGNWIKYLVDKKYNIYYNWIYDIHSVLNSGYNLDLITNKYCINNFPLDMLFTQNIESIIICRSGEWVPDTVIPLYNIWKEKYGI